MKLSPLRCRVVLPAAAVLAGLACLELGRAAQPSAELARQRQELLRDFPRIGLNTAPEDAAFLQLMVECTGVKRGVEVGTATGYGALHMGLGFERNGGELITIDIDPQMVEAAVKNVREMQLEETVKVIEGDALKVLAELTGTFDFAFLDAVKSDYLKYFRLIEPKLARGAVIIADNVIQSADAMRDFLDAIGTDPKYHMVIIRASDLKRDGMAVIYKRE